VSASPRGRAATSARDRGDDAELRDGMRRAHVITLAVALNVRAGLARLETATVFRVRSDHCAVGPVTLARAASL
jgi:hypothetical protein